MNTLKIRISRLGQNPASDYTPIKNNFVKNYGAVKMQPTVRVLVGPGTLYYDELTPLIAPDGGVIPATGPGTWGQVYMAGRRGPGR